MPHVLFYEPRPDYAKQLSFLLHLGDFHYTLVSSVEEMLNRLSVAENTKETFDVLLLGAPMDASAGRLLQSRAQGKNLPIIYHLREGDEVPDYLTKQVRVCRAENLLPCLQEWMSQE